MKTFKVGNPVFIMEKGEKVEGVIAQIDNTRQTATVYFRKPVYNLRKRTFRYDYLHSLDETALETDDYLDLMNLAKSLGQKELYEDFMTDLRNLNTH
ncbi:hypothetical protein F7984_12200 [Pradoshia sp. D12]|uniref:hypothetical protein n=1 Tax=Bacillaceae TaxID=186817 RepID=UPI00080AE230|nr:MULTISPECIES: hypothetical protein [Bacillaceae]OCA83681.1 hypothetical protein A8L44_12740 [Bacillus sp. FJAT-27986]QFK71935.1 hypothetical protein F7984_12200 [Pradoshia sp. D12]TPF73729.1 hypothetical protein FHY44_08600 [Bacillus sp. D12]